MSLNLSVSSYQADGAEEKDDDPYKQMIQNVIDKNDEVEPGPRTTSPEPEDQFVWRQRELRS